MQTRPRGEFDVLIAQDGGVAKARRIMAALLKSEESTAAQATHKLAAPATA